MMHVLRACEKYDWDMQIGYPIQWMVLSNNANTVKKNSYIWRSIKTK